METVQQNGRFTLFSSKFSSNIYSILYVYGASMDLMADDLKFFRITQKTKQTYPLHLYSFSGLHGGGLSVGLFKQFRNLKV